MKPDKKKAAAIKLQAKQYIVYRNREIRRKLDDLKKKGKGKGKATAVKQHHAAPFTIYKDTAGRPRWVSISSNAFRDKDREIVSMRALKTAVNRADSLYKRLKDSGVTEQKANLKARGPLRWWHVPGLDFGICDFQMVSGRMLIESGTINNDTIALKMAKAKGLNVSIGFRHPRTEPNKNGIFNDITIFERSPTPHGKAANNFTSLSVKGAHTMTKQQKIAAFIALLGEDEIRSLMGTVKEAEAEAVATVGDVLGESYKGDSTDDPTASQLMDLWTAYKAAEAEEAEGVEGYEDLEFDMSFEDDTDGQALKADQMVELKASMGRIETSLKGLMEMLQGREGNEKKKETAVLSRIAQLEAEISRLKGEAPRSSTSYRATLDAEPVEDSAPSGADWEAQKEKAVKEMGHAGQFYEAAGNLSKGLFG